jgi:hypothetical protein
LGLAEWLYEAGIGENRAALLDGDALRAVRIERPLDGLLHGAIAEARLVEPKIVELATDRGKQLASLQGRAPVPLGGRFAVEVMRMAIKERGRHKLARVRCAADGLAVQNGPTLLDRISASQHPVTILSALTPGEDRLESAGWTEMMERAQRGFWEFDGGALWIDPTPAMTVIDIDGEGDGHSLARAGCHAAVAAIEAFDIGGPIGIDFPSLSGRAQRMDMDALVDERLALPFERTATNGYGFMQIIRRRDRPNFIEQIRYDGVATDAALLLRRAERTGGTGPLTLTSRPSVIDWISAHPDWTAQLQQICGRSVHLTADPSMKGMGHVQ